MRNARASFRFETREEGAAAERTEPGNPVACGPTATAARARPSPTDFPVGGGRPNQSATFVAAPAFTHKLLAGERAESKTARVYSVNLTKFIINNIIIYISK